MKRMTRTGYVIAGTTAAALVLGGGIAVAYWTSSGTGTGTAAAGTTSAVTIAQTGSITGLYPGGDPATISIDITNPDASAVTIAKVTATVTGTESAPGVPIPGCTAADFTITGNAWDGGTIAGGATQSASDATIAMVNATSNQDACKGATVKLAFAAS